jgi:hypothetical protein
VAQDSRGPADGRDALVAVALVRSETVRTTAFGECARRYKATVISSDRADLVRLDPTLPVVRKLAP